MSCLIADVILVFTRASAPRLLRKSCRIRSQAYMFLVRVFELQYNNNTAQAGTAIGKHYLQTYIVLALREAEHQQHIATP